MKRILGGAFASLVLLALFAPADAVATDRQTKARNLAASCANCHGTDGHAQAGGQALAGRSKNDIITLMRLFREGSKPSTIMGQIAKGYTPEQAELIAEHFAAQKR